MDRFADERDFKLLEQDRYTFYVLRRILGGESQLLRTDHQDLILCFTGHPYPVWIWTPDGAPEEEMERAYQLARDLNLLEGGHHFNLKYDLAGYFIRRAAAEGKKMSIFLNMFAYDCLNPVAPRLEAEGALCRCESWDADELTDFIEWFHDEVGIDQKDREAYRQHAGELIRMGNVFFWRDEQGKAVASCQYSPNGDMASLGLVYTLPEYRRRHFAENLVYQVTRMAREAGYLPMLYTNADYVASNACYEKIGYVLRGKLCTVGMESLKT